MIARLLALSHPRERSYNISATSSFVSSQCFPSSYSLFFSSFSPFVFLLPSLSFCFSRLNFSFIYFLSLSILCSSSCFFFFQLHFYNFSKFFKFYFCFYVFSFLHFLSCISSHFFFNINFLFLILFFLFSLILFSCCFLFFFSFTSTLLSSFFHLLSSLINSFYLSFIFLRNFFFYFSIILFILFSFFIFSSFLLLYNTSIKVRGLAECTENRLYFLSPIFIIFPRSLSRRLGTGWAISSPSKSIGPLFFRIFYTSINNNSTRLENAKNFEPSRCVFVSQATPLTHVSFHV